MEVFTLCDCDNITNSYLARYEQNKLQSQSEKNAQCEWALSAQTVRCEGILLVRLYLNVTYILCDCDCEKIIVIAVTPCEQTLRKYRAKSYVTNVPLTFVQYNRYYLVWINISSYHPIWAFRFDSNHVIFLEMNCWTLRMDQSIIYIQPTYCSSKNTGPVMRMTDAEKVCVALNKFNTHHLHK